MKKVIFSTFALSVTVFCTLVSGQSGSLSSIPSHLLECYQNASFYDRVNRLPMTMPVFIELVRTIEQHPQFTMNLQGLALSLIHMFRIDGIEETTVSDPTVVLPFTLTGYQLNKHRILTNYLIPRSSYAFPNASLTTLQKCSLHFMLSNSIDLKQRGDENTVCNVISGNRYKRQAENPPEVAQNVKEDSPNISILATDNKSIVLAPNSTDNTMHKPSIAATENLSAIPNANISNVPPGNQSPAIQNSSLITNSMNQPPATEVTEPQVVARAAPITEPESDLSSKEQEVELISPVITKESSNINPQEKKGDMQMNVDGDSRYVAASSSTESFVKSTCPVENGVVYTNWGTVSLGTVLAGIATGLEQQNISLKDMGLNLDDTTDRKVSNQWAATLAGDLAEVAVRQGPKGVATMKVGASGGWNSTQFPKWYFIDSPDNNEMTDAEIRGGIDGLILSTFIRDWNQKANSYLRLSTILERYYSARGMFEYQYQACKRQNLYAGVTPIDTMKEQAFNFATAMGVLSLDVVSITPNGITQFTEAAIQKLNSLVASSISDTCPTLTTQQIISNNYVEPHVDLHVIIDCSWNYNDISGILTQLRSPVGAPWYSNFTVYSGYDFTNLMNSTNTTLNSTEYSRCQGGMDLKRLLEQDIKAYFTDYLEFEKNQSFTNSYATLVLFIPNIGFSPSTTDLNAARSAVSDYRIKLPDVTFLFLTPGSSDNLQFLVANRTSDIFTFTDSTKVNVDDLVTRIVESPRRITNPKCGTDLTEAGYNTLQYKQYVSYQGINYYRVHQRYLFPATSINIKFRADYGSLKICYSRRNQLPDNVTTSDGTNCLSASGSTEGSISLSEPCSGYEYVLQCPPLYISVQSTETTPTYRCQDQRNCRNVDDIQYTISHSGLTCGVANLLANPFTLALGIILMSFFKLLFSSS